MTEDTRDYRRAKGAALQALAAGGDAAAARELERRGVAFAPAIDVTTLDTAQLRTLVAAWRDGTGVDERARHRKLAEEAYAEIIVRYRVDVRLQPTHAVPPGLPPWVRPRTPRCEPWRRPQGSKLYPSDADRDRSELNELSRTVYQQRNAAGAPQD